MPRSRKNKLRRSHANHHLSKAWLYLLGVLFVILLIIIFITPSAKLVPIVAAVTFISSILTIIGTLKSGVLYAHGTAISRNGEPAQFWCFLALLVLPVFLVSSYLLWLSAWSLFRA